MITAAGISLCVLVALSPRHPVYDEPWFLDTFDLLKRHGLSIGFLREFPGAAGPTFTLVFAFVDSVVTLRFPWLRFVNVALLMASIVLLWRILKPAPDLPALSSGPAMLSVCLVMLPCLALAFGWPPAIRRHDIPKAGLIVAAVALIAGPVFIVWGGLIPPLSAWSGGGFSPANGLRSAGYAGLITFLFAPEIFHVLLRRKILLAAAFVLSVPVASALGPVSVPMASVARTLSAEALTGPIAAGFSVLLSFSAICFAGCFAIYIWQERTNWLTRFAGSTALLGILSNAKITHQFSSRYVQVFLPFIVLVAAPAVRMSWHQPLRLAIGACISLGALASYNFGQ